MKRRHALLALAALAPLVALFARADLRGALPHAPDLLVVTRPLTATGAVDREAPATRQFYKGRRTRFDMFSDARDDARPTTSFIMDCDSSRMITIDWNERTYMLMTFDEFRAFQRSAMEMAGRMGALAGRIGGRDDDARGGGVVTVTTSWADSVEARRFGLPVRWVRETVDTQASENACVATDHVETHRWVTDLDLPICVPPVDLSGMEAPVLPPTGGGCRDSVVQRTVGTPRLGFILREERISMVDGRRTISGTEVVELSREPLPDSLFVPPAGFERTEMPSLDGMAAAGADAGPAAVGPKAAGTIRIGVAVDAPPDSPAPAPALADDAVEWINEQAGYDAVRLQARDRAGALAEAPGVEADYVLVVNLREASAKVSRGGLLGAAIAGAVGAGGGGGTLKVEAVGGWQMIEVEGAERAGAGDIEEEKRSDDPPGVLADVMSAVARAAVAAIR